MTKTAEVHADSGRAPVVLGPGGTPHDFENRSGERAGFLNDSAPGDFEEAMPGIADWLRNRSGDSQA